MYSSLIVFFRIFSFIVLYAMDCQFFCGAKTNILKNEMITNVIGDIQWLAYHKIYKYIHFNLGNNSLVVCELIPLTMCRVVEENSKS